MQKPLKKIVELDSFRLSYLHRWISYLEDHLIPYVKTLSVQPIKSLVRLYIEYPLSEKANQKLIAYLQVPSLDPIIIQWIRKADFYFELFHKIRIRREADESDLIFNESDIPKLKIIFEQVFKSRLLQDVLIAACYDNVIELVKWYILLEDQELLPTLIQLMHQLPLDSIESLQEGMQNLQLGMDAQIDTQKINLLSSLMNLISPRINSASQICNMLNYWTFLNHNPPALIPIPENLELEMALQI